MQIQIHKREREEIQTEKKGRGGRGTKEIRIRIVLGS